MVFPPFSRSAPTRQIEFFLQQQKLGLMQHGEEFKQVCTLRLKMHRHLAAVLLAGNTLDQAGLLATIDQGDNAVVFSL
jgi:hypothetical protein